MEDFNDPPQPPEITLLDPQNPNHQAWLESDLKAPRKQTGTLQTRIWTQVEHRSTEVKLRTVQ